MTKVLMIKMQNCSVYASFLNLEEKLNYEFVSFLKD